MDCNHEDILFTSTRMICKDCNHTLTEDEYKKTTIYAIQEKRRLEDEERQKARTERIHGDFKGTIQKLEEYKNRFNAPQRRKLQSVLKSLSVLDHQVNWNTV
jgi:hypothetical protein